MDQLPLWVRVVVTIGPILGTLFGTIVGAVVGLLSTRNQRRVDMAKVNVDLERVENEEQAAASAAIHSLAQAATVLSTSLQARLDVLEKRLREQEETSTQLAGRVRELEAREARLVGLISRMREMLGRLMDQLHMAGVEPVCSLEAIDRELESVLRDTAEANAKRRRNDGNTDGA